MARDLETDQQTLRTILSHVQARDFQRAADLAEQTLAGGFEHPLLLNVMATRLEQRDDFEGSLRLLQRALQISPGDVGARNAICMCLQRLDRPEEALQHIDELLKIHPELGFAHANKGNALIALGALGRARQSHMRAVELEPGNFAAMAALASIATHRGEHAQARSWAQRTLALAPGYPDAVLSLAAAELADGATERAEPLLHQLILQSRAGPTDKARATGLLADVLHASGRYAEAFEAYTTCNTALRQIHRRFADGSGVRAQALEQSAAVRNVNLSRWAADTVPQVDSSAAAGHVFLLGFPRSGTTLLEVALDAHPLVASSEEHELLSDAVRVFMREPLAREPLDREPLDLTPLARADERQLSALRTAYWQRASHTGAQIAGKVFVDKHPLNTLKLPLIARLFPQAKILFACRDPRDVVLSCFRRRFKMNPAMFELLTLQGAAEFYAGVMDFAALMRPILGLDWQVVRYESLVADFELQTRAICEFLGVEWIAGLEDFAARVQRREHSTPSTAQLARGLNRESIGVWRDYAIAMQPVLPTLQRWVDELEYAQ